jgi:AcrR family transcriptional regulator/DNA-binding MarR family transcriptional regulator
MVTVAQARTTARKRVSRSAQAQPRAGATQVTEVQRTRMLAATVQVVGELGYEKMSVARVTSRAGVSRRTFYDLFVDREACFLAAFTETVERARALACDAAADERDWRTRVRAGLASLLQLFAEDPLAGRVLVVDVLKAGPAVLERRARIVAELIEVVEGGRAQVRGGRDVAPLTAEGVVGAVLAVVHTRLLGTDGDSLTELLNPLMAMIVRPYLGAAAAEKELERPLPVGRRVRRKAPADPLGGLDMRLTYRTLRVLATIAAAPGASNREVAQAAGVVDQGQISKLLTRLENLGLIHNSGVGHLKGEPNAWELTVRGREVEQAIRGKSAVIANHEEGAVQ